MTSIDFYTQVDDKYELARRLCIKAHATRARLVLWLPDPASCQRLSRLIWSNPATGFVPHCPAGDKLAAVTPIILDCEAGPHPHDEVLINLRNEVPPFFSRFQRMIELVSAADEEDKQQARGRYRHYRDRGYEIRTIDVGQAGS